MDEINTSLVWSPTSDGGRYPRHRIPGIVVTRRGTVIIYCEARTGITEYSLYDKNDWCLMDIYCQRSTDGGETFGEPIYLARGTERFATVNNPVMIVGNDNVLHLLFCRNYGMHGAGIWYRRSTDDGLTWSPERELTEFAASTPHNRIAFGPTHGICTRDGRLMTAVWMTEPAHSYVFYSDDNGRTWAVSAPADANTNETNVAELSDGSILLNSRATPFRLVTVSPDGISGWSPTRPVRQLPDPSCCAGMTTVRVEGLQEALLFVNCASTEGRTHVTLRCSFDDGNTYPKSVLISEQEGGYADVAVDGKGCIYVLYESDWGRRVFLARLDFEQTFCADEADAMRGTQTAFAFDSEQALTLVRRRMHVDCSCSEGVLRMAAGGPGAHRVTLDVSPRNRNLNLSVYRAIVLRLRVSAAKPEMFGVEFCLRSGRALCGEGGRLMAVEIPADGAFHTVLLDLCDLPAVRGMLRSIQLRFFTDVFICSPGDALELASLEFFPTLQEAEQGSIGVRNAGAIRYGAPIGARAVAAKGTAPFAAADGIGQNFNCN